MLDPAREARRTAGPAFDLSAAKLWRPRARPGSVRRSSLIDRLARTTSRPIVTVVAPAGYGKTTLLAQWAERNGQAFAWVSVDEADNWQGRVTTVQRWLRWLDDRDGIEGHSQVAADACILAAVTGRPVEAERWADVVDRRPDQDPARRADPAAEAHAALARTMLCRRGVEQMRADADETARRFAAANIVMPAAAYFQGIARVLSGDLHGGDAFFEDAIGIGESAAPDILAGALCQRSLLAMTRGDWDQAEALAREAAVVLRRARIEDSYASPPASAVQARVALHHSDSAAARRALVRAQRLRPLLTYAFPSLAVQARIELSRVHLALADIAGARTVMREIDGLLKRRPGLGTLVGEAEALRDRLAEARDPGLPGASALTGAELRLLPMLCTHLSLPEIGAELFLSPHTIRSQAYSLYRKLEVTSRSQAVARSRELGLLEG